MSKLKPHYSGDLSRKFWNKINTLSKIEQEKLYACGVLLQNLEGSVLTWLSNAKYTRKKGGRG